MEKCLIVAKAQNGAIGKDNQLLWHISGDLKYFKKVTYGYPVIMGSNTFRSIGKVLPGRDNIIITSKNDVIEGAFIAHSLEEAYNIAEDTGKSKCFIIGGASIYAQALKDVETMYITEVYKEYDADTFFPPIRNDDWIIEREERILEETENFEYSYCVYRKKDLRKIFKVPEIFENTKRELSPSEKETVFLRVTNLNMIRNFYDENAEIRLAETKHTYMEIENEMDNTIRKIHLKVSGFKQDLLGRIISPSGEVFSVSEFGMSVCLLSPLGRVILGRNKRVLYSNGERMKFIIKEFNENINDSPIMIINQDGDIELEVDLTEPDYMDFNPEDKKSGAIIDSLNENKDKFILCWIENGK